MKKIICLVVITSLTITLLVSLVQAQDKQWLQYRSAREAAKTIGSVPGKYLSSTDKPPQGVELSKFECSTPLFVRWLTPMVRAGGLWIGLDRSDTSKVYDRLFIDSNGDGNLKDETAVIAYRAEQQHAYFGPAKVIFEGKDGPITYHLNFRLCDHGQRLLLVSPGGWYEGTVTVGQQKKRCMLIDYNANGTFDDKSFDSAQADRIRIGEEGNLESRCVGNYLEVGDLLYQLEVAKDGAYVKLAAAEDVNFGNIRLPESITEFAAGGENGLFILKPKKGTGSLPTGQYRIDHWAIERKDDAGFNRWADYLHPRGPEQKRNLFLQPKAQRKTKRIHLHYAHWQESATAKAAYQKQRRHV